MGDLIVAGLLLPVSIILTYVCCIRPMWRGHAPPGRSCCQTGSPAEPNQVGNISGQ